MTADAMHCQKETAKKLRGKGAHYVLSLKQNHPTFFEAVSSVFAQESLSHGFYISSLGPSAPEHLAVIRSH